MIYLHESKDPLKVNDRINSLINALRKKEILSLIIEPTSNCNLACNFCAMHNDSLDTNELKGHMSVDTWGEIFTSIKELSYKINMIQFHGYGEPLLNKNLFKMINDIRPYAKVIRVISNGVALSYDNHKKLLDAGTDEVHVSLDVLDQQRYKEVKGKDKFLKVYENVNQGIELYNVFTNSNFYLKLALPPLFLEKKWGENSIKQNDFYDAYKQLEVNFKDRTNIHLKIMPLFTTYEGAIQYKDDKPCEMPFYMAKIRFDGTIDLCCAAIFGELSVGNIRDVKLKIHNESKKIRIAHLSGEVSKKLPMCGNCGAKTAVDLTNYTSELYKFI
jgi:MoaA/NifB/PqqE/SkfB family radical SAM enzyme